jgi:hypothetical protein
LFFSAVFGAVVLAGCTERELSERPSDGPLKIRLEWPAGHANISGAQLYLYASDGTLYRRIECAASGHECRVPADSYTILAVNSDCSNASCLRTESPGSCRMGAGSHPTEEGVLLHVSQVYCIGQTGIEVAPGNRAQEVTLYPRNRVKFLHFDIDPSYVDDIRDMQLRMTGVVPSVLVSDGSDAQEATQHILAEASATDDGGYTADMSVFGWRGESLVTAAITYTDGREEVSLPQDIGNQLSALPEEGGTIHLTLALPDGGEIMLTVTVEAWQSGTGSGTVI